MEVTGGGEDDSEESEDKSVGEESEDEESEDESVGEESEDESGGDSEPGDAALEFCKLNSVIYTL